MTRKKVRKLLAVILSFIMIMTMLPGGLQPMKAYAADEVGSEPALSEGVYQITSAEQLKWFADKVNSGQNEINGKLMNDIDLSQVCHSETETNQGDAVNWTPIGDRKYNYNGTFDGNGKKITGLFGWNGLFGLVDENGRITNIGVDGSVNGFDNVGGVVDWNFGIVSNCYNIGSVSGSTNVGGVVGYNLGIVSSCYNTGSVMGGDNVGGVVGCTSGMVNNSYYLDENGEKKGIGYGKGQAIGKTEAEFKSGEITYLLNRYQDGAVWYQTLEEQEYPTLDSTHNKVYIKASSCKEYTNNQDETGADTHSYDKNGICTDCGEYQKPELIDGKYQIKNAGNLAWFTQYVASGCNDIDAVLTNDIELSSVCHAENEGVKEVDWLPIGIFPNEYNGTFNGNGKKVSGLYINNEHTYYQGLFGAVGKNGSITNIGVEGKIIGGDNSGGVVAYNEGTVSNCYNTGSVTGHNQVGGVAGWNTGSVSNCYNTGSVTGYNQVGGVAGYNTGSVSNCYNTGSSSIGLNEGTVEDVENKTEEQFKSGEVAYLLNGGKNIPDDQTVTWYQKIGTDQFPVLTSTGDNKVYYGYASVDSEEKEYTNSKIAYEVNITYPEDSHITRAEKSGEEQQRVIGDAIDSVIYTADDGYYFPATYTVTGSNGITVTRDSYTQITVSGTPTADASITLKAATKKESQEAPSTYAVTVNNGTGDGSYAKGATVTITADAAPSGQEFDKWTVVSGGVTLASATSATTTFTMPANAVEVTATYKNATTSIAQAEVSGVSDKNYTGKTLTQSNLTLKIGNTTLKPNIDYTVSYSNNKNVGTATITIDGKGKYTGTMKKTFQITLSTGKTYTVSSMKYKVTNADTKGKGTVTLIGTTKKKTDKKFTSLSVGSTVKIGGVSFKITAIGDNAFKGYTKIKKVTVGNNVETIGKSAFSGCSTITTVTLGTRVKSIGASAFYNCKKLSKLTIKSKKLSSVGSKAIKNIKKNATIDVPDSKVKAYKKLFKSSTGFKKTMKIK